MRGDGNQASRLVPIWVLGFWFVCGALQAQIIVPPERENFYVRWSGRVLAKSDGHPVPYATVFNRTTKKGTVADTAGYFTTVISHRDTLEVRRVGYKTVYYVKPPSRNSNYYEEIFLGEDYYELKEVTIYRKRQPLRSIALNPEYQRDDPFKIYLFNAGRPKLNERAGIGSPVTALYEAFSKREQNNRKLATLKADRQLRDLAAIRYNEYYVESLTGLKGHDLEAFMGYCPLNAQFIITASDYELAVATLNCYRRFMNDL
jgi:hypothetical protein